MHQDSVTPLLDPIDAGDIEPRLRAGALVAADYLPQESFIDPHTLDPYRHYIADPVNGYLVVDVPLGDTISLALRVR